MGAIIGTLIGPIIGGLFNHRTGSVEGALGQYQATAETDQIASIATQTAMAHKSSLFAQATSVRQEDAREVALLGEFALSVQTADQHLVQKQMRMIEDSAQA